ncbi:MAG TPA: hypothetical protein IGS52_16200 [Oscillatoriaceae cyanobacterium M33_DOE_052]|uniref:Phasin family protein n=1 Tax=Planktothricoides sp. SpSt-374 TaxID=2282167 RepID=A0A7C3ZWV4_9CYAN|nr:hypothetical protein [Oscillatoriaceae cyanobacterium M33_DOE_052]
MPGFGDIVQKAFYLGVGLASYAGEKAGDTLSEVQKQAQKLAAELVEKGEMTTEEARKFVEDMVKQGQNLAGAKGGGADNAAESATGEPRRIEILDEEAPEGEQPDAGVNNLRQQVKDLEEELRRLQKE